ncbi:MAG: hypothetical protein SV862_06275 [Pseudomonadota bacterium]|nr:hypothetical protein [Pseudomonadota bacterium]
MKNLLILSLSASVVLLPGAAFSQSACQTRACEMPLEVLVAQNEAAPDAAAQEPAVPAEDAEGGDGWLDRARRAVGEAGREIGEAATATGRSASEYLSDNPDLNREVIEFGQNLGVPGFEASPARGSVLDVTATTDGELQIVAAGLPGSQEVRLGWLEDGRFVELQRLSSDDNGRVETAIAIPAALPDNEEVRLAIETTDQRLRLASDLVKLP